MTSADAVDLTNCDREPISVPGSVQPHGALLACGPDGRLAQLSANASAYLGVEIEPGMALEDVVGARQTAALSTQHPGGPPSTMSLEVGGNAYHAAAHFSDGLHIIELERAGEREGPASFEVIRSVVLRLSAANSVAELCEVAATELRALTGFDRVMIYRFDDQWNGEVVAEDRAADLNPFLGLHYPATDIPAQARALYAANWIRLIADVGYVPSPLVPTDNPLTERPTDLSSAVLRSVSPIHIEYLTNMGVAASMSVSLMSGDRLWGLIACHHYAGPHHPSQPTRAAAEFLGQVLSLLLGTKQRADDYDRRIAVRALQTRLATELGDEAGGSLGDHVAARGDLLLQLVEATGAAARLEGQWVTAGATPDPAELDDIAQWLWRDAEGVVSTASLGLDNPAFAHLTDRASGVLGVAVTRDEARVLWFRPEVVRTVDWGGDPQNKVIAATEGDEIRLSPRKSFDLWKQTVQSTSLPWAEVEIDAAADFGRHLAGLVLKSSQENADVARTLQQGLASEVTDRVGGMAVAARYRTGGLGDVGGDWYDALDLPGGGVAVIIGDVAGHGVAAATTMGHLRHSARAYLLEERSPGAVLDRLNRLTTWVLEGEIATALVAIFLPGRTDVHIASAGHLPPLSVAGDAAEFLAIDGGPALGVTEAAVYPEIVHPLDDQFLLLFTDGLVERRGESIDAGLARLAGAAVRHSRPGDFLDDLLEEMVAGRADDDLAVVLVRRHFGE